MGCRISLLSFTDVIKILMPLHFLVHTDCRILYLYTVFFWANDPNCSKLRVNRHLESWCFFVKRSCVRFWSFSFLCNSYIGFCVWTAFVWYSQKWKLSDAWRDWLFEWPCSYKYLDDLMKFRDLDSDVVHVVFSHICNLLYLSKQIERCLRLTFATFQMVEQ